MPEYKDDRNIVLEAVVEQKEISLDKSLGHAVPEHKEEYRD